MRVVPCREGLTRFCRSMRKLQGLARRWIRNLATALGSLQEQEHLGEIRGRQDVHFKCLHLGRVVRH